MEFPTTRQHAFLFIVISAEGTTNAAALLAGMVMRLQVLEALYSNSTGYSWDDTIPWKDIKQFPHDAVGTGGETWSNNGVNSTISLQIPISGAWRMRIGAASAGEFPANQPDVTVVVQANNPRYSA